MSIWDLVSRLLTLRGFKLTRNLGFDSLQRTGRRGEGPFSRHTPDDRSWPQGFYLIGYLSGGFCDALGMSPVKTTPGEWEGLHLVTTAEAGVGVRGHFRQYRDQWGNLDTASDMARMRGAYDGETEKGICAETI